MFVSSNGEVYVMKKGGLSDTHESVQKLVLKVNILMENSEYFVARLFEVMEGCFELYYYKDL